jgi:hypothetical protein
VDGAATAVTPGDEPSDDDKEKDMTAQQTTVHIDPVAVAKAVDAALVKLQRDGVDRSRTPIDRLVEQGLITQAEASLLRALLTQAQSGKKLAPATVVKDIDAVLSDGTAESPVVTGILKTIRLVADAHVQAASGRPQAHERVSQPPPPPLEAAAEGAVLGGCGGASVGAAVGAAATAEGGPLAALGAAAGAVIGGVIGAAAGAATRGLGAWLSS